MNAIFRIDRFDVPAAALEEFVGRVRHTQKVLGGFPGCKTNLVLTGPRGDRTHILTIVEWEDQAAFDQAKTRMQQQYRAEGFDPAAFTHGHGIKADLGVYNVVPA